MLLFSAATGLLGIFASPAYPWGSKGHEIVAAIAETQLTDTTRKRIKELLPQGMTLAEASVWPDKAGRQIPDMDLYHFINPERREHIRPAAGLQAAELHHLQEPDSEAE